MTLFTPSVFSYSLSFLQKSDADKKIIDTAGEVFLIYSEIAAGAIMQTILTYPANELCHFGEI